MVIFVKYNSIILRSFIIVIIFCSLITLETSDVHADYVHRINLYDQENNIIGPSSTVPYSPKKTCGKSRCHDYSQIAKGNHFKSCIEVLNKTIDQVKEINTPWIIVDEVTGTQIGMSLTDADQNIIPFILPYKFAKDYGAYYPGGDMLKQYQDQYYNGKDLTFINDSDKHINHDIQKKLWDKSGDLEIDCLLCHLGKNYDHHKRIQQLKSGNFKWGATSAAGFGNITGSVLKDDEYANDEAMSASLLSNEEIKVMYNPWIFDPDGTVTIDIPSRIPDRNCLFCHLVEKPVINGERASRYNTNDDDNNVEKYLPLITFNERDIHVAAGMGCIDCHRSDIEHNIVKPSSAVTKIGQKSENNDLLSCSGCHASGLMGAPGIEHPHLPKLHLGKIACTTCHSGYFPGKSLSAFPVQEVSNTFVSINNIPLISWSPIYKTGKDNKIYPYRYISTRWWGNKKGNKVSPFLPEDISTAFEEDIFSLDAFEEDIFSLEKNSNTGLEIKTTEEITATLTRLEKIVINKNLSKVNPVYVDNGKIYEISPDGNLFSYNDDLASPILRRISHNVRPARLALGGSATKGCQDCHSKESAFFFSSLVIKDETGKPVRHLTKTLSETIGYTELLVQFSVWRDRALKQIGIWLIPLSVFLCLLHYITFGPKPYQRNISNIELKRFSVFERWMHFLLLCSFIVLAITGLCFIITGLLSLRSTILTNLFLVKLHTSSGFAFIIASLMLVICWPKVGIFKTYDLKWFKSLGGYFGKQYPLSGKFNAGQKLFFWFIIFMSVLLSTTGLVMRSQLIGATQSLSLLLRISYSIHDVAAIILIPSIVIHVYMVTIANPGTLRAIFHGKVDHEWAKKHHQIWHDKEMTDGREYNVA